MTTKPKKLTCYHCTDCQIHTRKIGEYYVVKDEIWECVTKDNPAVMLCIDCLEKRLSHIFEIDICLSFYDFKMCPVNFSPECMSNHSQILRNRMSFIDVDTIDVKI